MGLPDHGEFTKLPPGEPWPGQTAAPISSLHEAWFHTANRCVSDGPMNEVILPLMRNCFFGGALHAVLLLQKGLWRSASFRYHWLHQRRATVVTRVYHEDD